MHLSLPRLVRDFLEGDVLHLAARKNSDDDGVSTSVSFVYKTASKTFAGPAVYVTQVPSSDDSSAQTTTAAHAHKTTAAQTTDNSSPTTQANQQTTSSPFVFPSLSTSTSDDSTSKSSHAASETTSTNLFPSIPGAGLSSTDSPTSSADPAFAAGGATSSPSPSSSAQSSGGLSGGAKAGLAIGIILILAAIGAAVLFCVRRKKSQETAGTRLDDEKGGMGYGQRSNQQANDFLMTGGAAGAYGNSFNKSSSVAPRVSLRPVTQLFGFGSNPNRKSGGNTLDLAAAGLDPRSGATSPRAPRSAGNNTAVGAGAEPQNSSAWEKMGQRDHANDPNNPFGDHAHTPNSGSPPKADSLAVPAAAGLAAAGVGAAAASRSPQPQPTQQNSIVPKPLSIKSTKSNPQSGAVSPPPVSPTFTESSQTTASLAAGAAPGPAGPNNVHRVQIEFKPSMDDELELQPGQLVRMLHEYDDGWALCIRMDRSQQGVVPRTCLSKHAVKPRPPPNGQGPRGPPPNGAYRNGPPGSPFRGPPPMGPPGGRNSPGPYGPPRAMTPTGRNSPNPSGPPPFGYPARPDSPGMRGPPGPGGRARSGSVPRSMSPGPYPSSPRSQMAPGDTRRRSNSMSQLMGAPPGGRRMSPPGMSPLGQGQSNFSRPQRKPVPGMQ